MNATNKKSAAPSEYIGPLIGDTARMWRAKLNQRLKPLGLSQAQWFALLHLSRAERDLTQTELAERIGIEGPTLVRLLDRMARDKWIIRRESDLDRRSNTVHLTAQALAIIKDIQAAASQLRKELLKGIPATDLQHCIAVLERIHATALKI